MCSESELLVSNNEYETQMIITIYHYHIYFGDWTSNIPWFFSTEIKRTLVVVGGSVSPIHGIINTYSIIINININLYYKYQRVEFTSQKKSAKRVRK